MISPLGELPHDKNIFAVLCERFTPLTTFIIWQAFWIYICCFFFKLLSDQNFMKVIHNSFLLRCMVSEITRFYCSPDMTSSWFLRQGALPEMFNDGFWKSDHDFLIALNINFLSGLHGFWENEVLLLTGYDVIVIYPPGGASGNV